MPRTVSLATAVLAISMAAAAGALPAHAAGDDVYVHQVGTYDYLSQPDFGGLDSLSSVVSDATLGLGTFEGVDGEFVMVAGVPYRVGMDGRPEIVDTQRATPFAQAIDFRPDTSGPVAPGTTCANLAPVVQQLAGTDDGIVAVRVRGTFTDLVTRSVPAQYPPYPTLAEVVAQQATFPLPGRRSVLVGFWQGADLKGLGQPGLHLHGVTANRSAGGHVLSCVVGADVQVSVQRASGVVVHADH